MTTRYFDSPLPRVFAHRGLATSAPENTVAAFQAAIAAGADYVETDAHVTADGVAVLAHDPTIVVGQTTIEIASTASADLDALDLGAGERVPRLLDVLERFPDTPFNIDVKAPSAVPSVVSAIHSADARDRVLVTSFDGATRSAVLRALPGVATSASSDLVARALLPARLGLAGIVGRILRGVPCVQVPERHRGIAVVTRRSVRAFHSAGIEVHVWTVNDPRDMRRLLALGVDGIVTDRCDVALRTIGRATRS
ncbi:glycerophosphoryl diester phosphodiesterase [Labedella gwakjiensis]|uniref:Glycerophosphodiester phosphodiesterase n=1 Tax=Labedella gwakjiensis TaxID=390269 RepID=A0A2P8H016_9MICO|nr:glycerophosphodiester phosphodiesterase family protein [Labedella gwakjiensis]PSL39571.1 glycerophosphoryl diester phosphodiesterase [Labedella gwakjiensis]RUQ86033.1 glycerophosphodiester phosphodiesterase [Labedella gwakjiensis]